MKIVTLVKQPSQAWPTSIITIANPGATASFHAVLAFNEKLVKQFYKKLRLIDRDNNEQIL